MANIKDIAKASQVSTATVSNVLNNTRSVHPTTRARVLAAAREARYRPNAIARGLVGKRMNTIGVVYLHRKADANLDPYFVTILDGVLAQARERRQNVTLVTSGSWDDDEILLPSLCDGRCDGLLLVVPPRGDTIAPGLQAAGVPFVIIGSRSADPTMPCVDVDNVGGAERIVSYLIDQSHRRVAMLAPDVEPHFSFVTERVAGYRQALESHGLPYSPTLVRGHDFESMMERPAIEELLALPEHERPTALFCAFDKIALDALHILQDMGVQVPQDMSVVGFDDIPNMNSTPPLTTIRQPFRVLGERAAQRLLARIEKKYDADGSELLPTELVIRGSVAPPRN